MDISNEICEEGVPKRGATSKINNCLEIIEARLRVCNAQIDPKDITCGIGSCMRGICLSLDSAIFDAGYNLAQEDLWFYEHVFTTPLEQMRRLYKKHNILAHKFCIHIIYNKDDTAFAGFHY